MDAIETKGLSKDYGHGRGIFDVTFEVHKGEVYGFLGPNGAGKSTTMRHLMGFSRPKSGDAYIGGKDCWKAAYSGLSARTEAGKPRPSAI